jgi:hypothetical protein
MKHMTIVAAVLVVALALFIGFEAMSSSSSTAPQKGPPAARDPSVPRMPVDVGLGERLLLVVGGVYSAPADAEAANSLLDFGEMQGFYVVPVEQFEGLRIQLPKDAEGSWALVSAFRTLAAANQFQAVARMAGAADAFVTSRVTSLGGVDAGLGQEAAPNGRGPLRHPIPASMSGGA